MLPNQSTILRTIDANINRTNEAFRVVEDILRFGIEDRCLTNVCKNLRHDFATWARQFDMDALLSSRDAGGDVGRSSDVDSEYQRTGVSDILRANLSRATQSLRTLEEFAKTMDSQSAISVERIRYQVYDLQKAALLLMESVRRFDSVKLYVLIDACASIDDFRERVTCLIDSGVDAIQLRDKSLCDRERSGRAAILVQLTRPNQVLAIINDRVDIVMAVDADGVHLGQDDLPVEKARALMGSKKLIGVSAHTLEQAREAMLAGANYVGVGPTFPSTTKSFDQFPGLELVRDVVTGIRLPAIAIGGINSINVHDIVAAGCDRIAIAAAVPEHPDQIAAVIQGFRAVLQPGQQRRSEQQPRKTHS